jgi:copper homeostasis protein (lipoprotein)
MKGHTIGCACAVSALAALLAASGCKNAKSTGTAADAEKTALPSRTMSLHGMYRYMADAGLFLDCATGEQWPVATEEDNAALERAYGKVKVAPGSPLLVSVEGRLEPRDKMDGEGTETNLIVERFVGTWPGRTCENMNEMTLEDTRWALLGLNGEPIARNVSGKAPYLELSSKKSSAFGFGGCNRFFGNYQATERSLSFGAMGATRMACPEGMGQEQALFTALDSTTRYEIRGSELLLFADDRLVARFEATPQTE